MGRVRQLGADVDVPRRVRRVEVQVRGEPAAAVHHQVPHLGQERRHGSGQ